MQTFLPYPDFAASAGALDDSRLGKQRVEALQILRALVIPDYGWQQHPAVRMWMGHVPGLTLYGLAVVDEWLARGRSDSTRGQIQEFASSASGGVVPMPPWLGDPSFHAAHRSNLIRKSPEFYRERFSDVPDDLPYVWPEPAEVMLPAEPSEPRMWIWRGGVESVPAPAPAPTPEEETGWLFMPRQRSSKRVSPKWRRQVACFTDVVKEGDSLAVADATGTRFRTGVAGPLQVHGTDSRNVDGPLWRRVRFSGWLERSDFDWPARLQDPRTLFPVPEPHASTTYPRTGSPT
ncbi:MAG TPA: MSMEG_6728 family protein [Arthrobacter sp.]|nr:MSMEG_6728 family protein [Arthrobacter sp.]